MHKDFCTHKVLSYWALRIVPSVILLQSLLYKFGDDGAYVYIFLEMGLGDDMRLLFAVVEFIGSIFLVQSVYCRWGAYIGIFVSLLSIIPFVILGFELPVENSFASGLQLFGMSLVVLMTSLLILEQELGRIQKTSKSTQKRESLTA
ncbi:hypothetical protein [Flammeovirga sp. SubArs3]|uniref:hypothetical protein n=1 Tax=Flammeovirga sp. SubArs3 TaxID=2995316 RepID=UPI00248B6AF4|nr:hypothetical protein [Flammeovirga sp. SubArs3]